MFMWVGRGEYADGEDKKNAVCFFADHHNIALRGANPTRSPGLKSRAGAPATP